MDITKFVKTGIYQDIELGMNIKDVEKILGKKKKHFFDNENLDLGFSLFYNELELMIINDNVYGISIDTSILNEMTILDKFLINQYTSLETLIRFLDFVSIKWSFFSNETFNKQITIEIESGVKFSYTFTEGEILLHKFQKF
jgi:hypothetical protein